MRMRWIEGLKSATDFLNAVTACSKALAAAVASLTVLGVALKAFVHLLF